MPETETNIRRPSPWTNLLMGVLFVAFVIALVYLGIFLYASVRNFVASAPLPVFDDPLPILKVAVKTPTPVQPARAAGDVTPVPPILPDPERLERVNVLLLGVDQRPGQKGATRTDTMILLTVDPASRRAGVLSIPRDLWVRIPTVGYNKITTAHYYGDFYGYPGGGPALAMKTVEKELGVRPHYYVKVNFIGFERIIDLIGGIDIYVEKAINDLKYPDHNYGYDPLYIPAGHHHFNGEMALKYARTRHGDSDFARMDRQQQVIEAVVRHVLDTDQLNTLVKNAPALWQSLQDAVQTDMPLTVMLKLAPLAREIRLDDVQKVVIDRSMTQSIKTETNASALLPVREKIRLAVDALFHDQPVVDETQLGTLDGVAEEDAGLVIHNGTPTGSLAARTAAYLRGQGFRILQYGPVDTSRFDYARTVIIDYTGNPNTVRRLQQLFNLADDQIEYDPRPGNQMDVKIILGADYELPVTP
ncbi:MAG: LCP family protein [Anaerolineae bacterium]|nr:MAG: LCP family protein [Anaerolineae bacterium]